MYGLSGRSPPPVVLQCAYTKNGLSVSMDASNPRAPPFNVVLASHCKTVGDHYSLQADKHTPFAAMLAAKCIDTLNGPARSFHCLKGVRNI